MRSRPYKEDGVPSLSFKAYATLLVHETASRSRAASRRRLHRRPPPHSILGLPRLSADHWTGNTIHHKAKTPKAGQTSSPILHPAVPGAPPARQEHQKVCRQYPEVHGFHATKIEPVSDLCRSEIGKFPVLRGVGSDTAEIGQDLDKLVKNATAPDFKTFFDWVMDMYPRIGAGSSVKQYWRALRMFMEKKKERVITESDPDNKDILNVRVHHQQVNNLLLTHATLAYFHSYRQIRPPQAP